MIIIISALLLFILYFISSHKNRRTVSVFAMVIFASILLLTNGQFQGNDYPQYLNFYLGNGSVSMFGDIGIQGGYDLELPYEYYVKIVRFILPITPYSYILCYALMWIIPLYILLWKDSKNIPLSLFLLCTLLGCSQLLFIITAQRQMIATVSFLWIYLVLKDFGLSNKKKVIIVLLLSALALMAHSSSYFVMPILILLYFIKFPSKKIIYPILIISFIVGPIVQNYLAPLFYGLMISLGSGEAIARSTSYFIDETYEMGTTTYLGLLPTTLTCLIFLYYYDKKGIQNFGAKCFIFAVVLYNFFNYIPLLNRAFNAMFIFGVILGIPFVNGKRAMNMKLLFVIVALGLMYTTIKAYNIGANSTGLFPYPYIWE